eukprot:1152954-Pelagomonas_calceolata.AAC.1
MFHFERECRHGPEGIVNLSWTADPMSSISGFLIGYLCLVMSEGSLEEGYQRRCESGPGEWQLLSQLVQPLQCCRLRKKTTVYACPLFPIQDFADQVWVRHSGERALMPECLALRTGLFFLLVFHKLASGMSRAKSVGQVGLLSFKRIIAAELQTEII